MPGLKPVSGETVIKILSKQYGFVESGHTGSHVRLSNKGDARHPFVTIRAYRRWPLVDPSAARSSRRACIADLRGEISSRIVLQMIALLIPK